MARKQREKVKPFHQAYYEIANMQRAMFYCTVKYSFDFDYVVRWIWPADVIDLMTRARSLFKGYNSTMCYYYGPIPNVPLLAVSMTVDCGGVLFPPNIGGGFPDKEDDTIPYVIRQWVDIVGEFNKVRSVVEWLDNNATPRYARHMCPWLGAFLPEKHKFHTCDPDMRSEPATPPPAELMRECTTIVARGHLCPMPELDLKGIFKVEYARSEVSLL